MGELTQAIVDAQANHCDLSGNQIADRMGISRSYYSDIRKGNRMPSPEMLGRFSEVLQTPLEPLLWLWVEQHMDADKSDRMARWLRET